MRYRASVRAVCWYVEEERQVSLTFAAFIMHVDMADSGSCLRSAIITAAVSSTSGYHVL
jgi:hypothetical protein